MGPFIFLDTETTGIDPSRNSLIEVACIRWNNGLIEDRYETLIKPPVAIPQEIFILTGINDGLVATAPRFAEVKTAITDFIGDAPIVGHNIGFDTGFLRSHGVPLKNEEIDTLTLAKILLHKEKSYALEVLMKRYGLPVRTSHRAMVDTETTLDFFEFLLGKIREISREAADLMMPLLKKTSW